MVCESYDVTWMTLEGDCRKGCMWVTALCLSSLESRWTKSTTGALIEGLGRTHSIKRHAGDACPSPAGEEATVFLSLMHPRTSNCLSLRTERIQGERIWLFSFQARERLVPFLFSSIHYQVIPNNFILQMQEQTKKKSMIMVWVWVKPTGLIFISLLSKTSGFQENKPWKTESFSFDGWGVKSVVPDSCISLEGGHWTIRWKWWPALPALF